MKRSETNGIDIYEYDKNSGKNFPPLIQFGDWRVAAASENGSGGEPITAMSRHMETDEVFVLLKGSCTIFAGGNGDNSADITPVEMEPLRLYNIRRGTWHARIIAPGSLVLVVENRVTGDFNSETEMLERPVGVHLSAIV